MYNRTRHQQSDKEVQQNSCCGIFVREVFVRYEESQVEILPKHNRPTWSARALLAGATVVVGASALFREIMCAHLELPG